MQKYFPLCISLITIVLFSGPLYAMKRAKSQSGEEKKELKRERTELVDFTNLESTEKKAKVTPKAIIIRNIHTITWQPALIYGSFLRTLTPQENIESIELEVEPIVQAVYYDNVPLLEHILSTQAPDLTIITDNVLSTNEAGSLLDIAADRQSYRCLEYFKKLLTMPQPELTLQAMACQALCAQNKPELKAKAQLHCPDVDIDAQAKLGSNIHLYHRIVPRLCTLYKASCQSAYKIARMRGDIRCAQLICQPCRHNI